MNIQKCRYLEIDNTEVINKHMLEQSLTIKNPTYDYLKNTMKLDPSYIKDKKSFELFIRTDKGYMLPRHCCDDPNVSKWITSKSKEERIHSAIASKSKVSTTLKLLDFQVGILDDIISNNADIITAPCGSGKTTMGTYIIGTIERPAAVIVQTDFLRKQWENEINRFTKGLKIVLHNNSKVEESMKCDVMIASVQSLMRLEYNKFKRMYDRFNIAIFDEIHTMGSMEFCKVINMFPCRRVGLTATPERTDGFMSFKWSVGSRTTSPSKEISMIPVVIPFDTGIGSAMSRSSYFMTKRTPSGIEKIPNQQKLINHILSFESRRELLLAIINEMLKLDRHILVLVHRKAYATDIFNAVTETRSKLLKLGGSSRSKEDKIREPKLIVATFQYAKLAFNVPRLDTLINVTPYMAYNDTKQSTGRILRSHTKKKHPLVIDMMEVDQPDTNERSEYKYGYCYNMFMRRMSNYSKLGYKIYETSRNINSLKRLAQNLL